MARVSKPSTAKLSDETLRREIGGIRHRLTIGSADATDLRVLQLLEFEAASRKFIRKANQN